MQDFRKLRVWERSQQLCVEMYLLSADFPAEERYGITSQLRRAAVSVACNIVEGSARSTTREYVRFLNVACSSAAETRYLISLAQRLEMLPQINADLIPRSDRLVRSLKNLVASLDRASGEVSR